MKPVWTITTYQIYALCDPDTEEERYVSYTGVNTLATERSNAISTARSDKRNYRPLAPVSEWILELLKQGKEPTIKLLEECKPQEVLDRRLYWRKQFPNLLNKPYGRQRH